MLWCDRPLASQNLVAPACYLQAAGRCAVLQHHVLLQSHCRQCWRLQQLSRAHPLPLLHPSSALRVGQQLQTPARGAPAQRRIHSILQQHWSRGTGENIVPWHTDCALGVNPCGMLNGTVRLHCPSQHTHITVSYSQPVRVGRWLITGPDMLNRRHVAHLCFSKLVAI